MFIYILIMLYPRKTSTITNNTSINNNGTTINNHGNSSFNLKSLEVNIAKKVEAALENTILTKIGIKFDSSISDINKSLDALVESKVKKYLLDCGVGIDEKTPTLNISSEDIETLLSENLPNIIKLSIKKFPILEEVSCMAFELKQNNPNILSIPTNFDNETHIFIDPETKTTSFTLTYDLLKYFSESLLDTNLLNENMKLEFNTIIKNEKNKDMRSALIKNFELRSQIMNKNRESWLQFLRSIWKHDKIKELFKLGLSFRLKDSVDKNGLNVLSRQLGNHTHKNLFGLSKISCFTSNSDNSEEDEVEFLLPTAIGIR